MPEPEVYTPQLAVTLGDPAGIGPEVILKALAHPVRLPPCKITVVGSRSRLIATYHQLRSRIPAADLAHPDQLHILDVADPLQAPQIVIGQESAASGAARDRKSTRLN